MPADRPDTSLAFSTVRLMTEQIAERSPFFIQGLLKKFSRIIAFCELQVTPIVGFCNSSTHFFILSLISCPRYDFSPWIVDHSFLFLFIAKGRISS